MWDLHQPGIELTPPAVEAQSVLIIGPPGKSPNCFNILDFVGYTVSATTTQPCHYSVKEATGNMYNERV